MLPSVAEERTRKMNKMKYGNKKKHIQQCLLLSPRVQLNSFIQMPATKILFANFQASAIHTLSLAVFREWQKYELEKSL